MGLNNIRVTPSSPANPATVAVVRQSQATPAPETTASPASTPPPAVSLSQQAEAGKASQQHSFVEASSVQRQRRPGDNPEIKAIKHAINQSSLPTELKKQLLFGEGVSPAQARQIYQQALSSSPSDKAQPHTALLADTFYQLATNPSYAQRDRVGLSEVAELAANIGQQRQQLQLLKQVLQHSSIPAELGQKILVGEALTQPETRLIYQESCIGAQASSGKSDLSRKHDAGVMDLFWRLANQKLNLAPDELKARLAALTD